MNYKKATTDQCRTDHELVFHLVWQTKTWLGWEKQIEFIVTKEWSFVNTEQAEI